MRPQFGGCSIRATLSLALVLVLGGLTSHLDAADGTESSPIPVPSGVEITPTAGTDAVIQDLPIGLSSNPELKAGQAAAVALSPDGNLLAVLTNGFNLFHVGTPDHIVNSDYIFLFDVRSGTPRQLQALPIGNSFLGLAWTPKGDRLLVSGGIADSVLEFRRENASLEAERTIKLGHETQAGECLSRRPEGSCSPLTGAIAVSPDGAKALVANFENDSVSVLDIAAGRIVKELDLRPGKIDAADAGKPGGTYPRDVAWVANDRAYVTSARDREIVVLSFAGNAQHVSGRFTVPGQPTVLTSNLQSHRAYVVLESASQIAVLDTQNDKILEVIDVAAPSSIFDNVHRLGGAIPNSLALTRDHSRLLVTDAGENAVAVVSLSDAARGQDGSSSSRVIGLVPTGWYPTGITPSMDDRRWYITNLKSPTGPAIPKCGVVDAHGMLCVPETFKHQQANGSPGWSYDVLVQENQSVNQQEKGSLLTVSAPTADQLNQLTQQAAQNNHLAGDSKLAWPPGMLEFLRSHIKHVVYVVKANKSYDVVLGDMSSGNGDRRLAWFPGAITPNQHKISSQFVLVDNFRDASGVGFTGFDWSLAGRTSDLKERREPMAMARGGFYEHSGLNRSMDMGLETNEQRRREDPDTPRDPDVLAGARNLSDLDGPDGEVGRGYLWNSVLRAGKTVRNWGSYASDTLANNVSEVRDPHAADAVVLHETKPDLKPITDPYYHYQWDYLFPDVWRVEEWRREFDGFAKNGDAPNLMLMWICQDVGEGYKTELNGLHPPYGPMADNDYAFGEVVAAVANSPFAKDTLVVSMEDSSRDGPDHVDVHRSTMYIAGPYVKRHATVSTYYSSVNVIRTIEDILGASPNSIEDTFAYPMSDLFDLQQEKWDYEAVVPDLLKSSGNSPEAH